MQASSNVPTGNEVKSTQPIGSTSVGGFTSTKDRHERIASCGRTDLLNVFRPDERLAVFLFQTLQYGGTLCGFAFLFSVAAQKRQCMLVLMGATADGRKELIAVADGFRESNAS